MAIDDYAALAKDGDCVSGVGRILIIRPDRSMGGYVLRHIAREIFFREYNIPDPWTVALENKRHYNDDNMRVLNSLQSLSNDFVDVDHANGLLSILHQSGDTTPGYSVFDVPMTLLAKRPGTGEETSFSCANLQGLIAQLAAAKDFGFSLVCVVINHDWKKSETL